MALAQAAPPPTVPNTVLGALAGALFALAGVIGLFGKYMMNALTRAHEVNNTMANSYLDKAVPAIDHMTAATLQVLDVVKEQNRQLAAERDTRYRLEAELAARTRHPEGT